MEILAGGNVYVHCQYEYGIFDDVASVFVPIAEEVFNNEKYNGRKIAENDHTEIHMVKLNDCESRLYEFDKKENYHSAINVYLVRSAEGLAVAMWRYKNLGTIFT